MFVGKIPKGVSDQFIERVLKCCGSIQSFTRGRDANDEPKSFGFVEFETVEGVFAALRILHNYPMFETRLTITVDSKAQSFLDSWKDLKKQDWISIQEKAGQAVDLGEIEQMEAQGKIIPYERMILPNID